MIQSYGIYIYDNDSQFISLEIVQCFVIYVYLRAVSNDQIKWQCE